FYFYRYSRYLVKYRVLKSALCNSLFGVPQCFIIDVMSKAATKASSSTITSLSNNDFNNYSLDIGQMLQCTTQFGEVYNGELIAIDLSKRLVTLKCPSSKSEMTRHDIHYLLINSLADLTITRQDPAEILSPSIITEKIEERKKTAKEERSKFAELLRLGVSVDGLRLYASLSKTYCGKDDLRWKDHSIVVVNDVEIKPPYKESNCALLKESTCNVGYVQTLVKKFWDDQEKEKEKETQNSKQDTKNSSEAVP
ncbi:Protein LSM12-like A, partial [Fragariocoptes setiger]